MLIEGINNNMSHYMLALIVTVGKEEVKASLFEDNIVACISDPKKSHQKSHKMKKNINSFQ